MRLGDANVKTFFFGWLQLQLRFEGRLTCELPSALLSLPCFASLYKKDFYFYF
jgi:hypothetical protein